MEAKVRKQTIITFDLQFSCEHLQQAWQDLKLLYMYFFLRALFFTKKKRLFKK